MKIFKMMILGILLSSQLQPIYGIETTYEIRIQIVDEEGKALKGVLFSLSQYGDEKQRKQSDDEGSIRFQGVSVGTYQVYQLASVYGYDASNKPIEVSVDGKETTVDAGKIVNTMKKGAFVLKILDEEKKPMSNIEVVIYNQEKQKVKDVKLNEKGEHYVSDLPLGQYHLELKTVTSYQTINDEFSITTGNYKNDWTLQIHLKKQNELQEEVFSGTLGWFLFGFIGFVAVSFIIVKKYGFLLSDYSENDKS